jgi:hypothetical protein
MSCPRLPALPPIRRSLIIRLDRCAGRADGQHRRGKTGISGGLRLRCVWFEPSDPQGRAIFALTSRRDRLIGAVGFGLRHVGNRRGLPGAAY